MPSARDVMARTVHTVTPDTPLDELARKFTEHRVGGFPVVDASGALVGVVTETDWILRNQHLHIPTVVAVFDAVVVLGGSRKLEEELRRMTATTVGEIMTSDPATVTEDATLEQIAALMADRGAHTIPVVDASGALVGVVGKFDLIRAAAGK